MKIENLKNEKIENVKKEIWDLSRKSNNFSNPNYLLNSDFYFNQRGQNSYTSNTSKYTYTYDRWCLQKSAGTNHCIVENGKPRYKCSSSANNQLVFGQIMEYPEKFSDRTVTFWLKYSSLKNGSVRLAIQINASYFVYGEVCKDSSGTAIVTANIPSNCVGLAVWIEKYNGTSEWYIEPKEAKMEEGLIATPLTLNSVHQELYNLKKYFMNTNYLQGALFISSPDSLELIVDLNMRSNPTVLSFEYYLYSYNGDGNITTYQDTAFTHVGVSPNCLQFSLYRPQHGIRAGFFCITQLQLDSEIY